VQERFAKKFPETPVPHHNAVRRLNEKLRERGSALDAEQSGRQSKLNNKKLMHISDAKLWNPSESLCKLAQEEDIGLATAHKVVQMQICRKCLRIKLNGFRPVEMLTGITSITFHKCTVTFRTHCAILYSKNL
jgi:hypothetical protein